MINKIHIQNFKNIRDQTIELERLTLVVGGNAAGKTTLLEALHLAVRAATGDPKKVFGYERHCDWIYTRGGVGDLSLQCEASSGDFGITATPPDGYPPKGHEFLGHGIWQFDITPHDNDERRNALAAARSLVFLHLNASKLAKASYSDREPPRVEFDGEGLATVLAYMLLTDRDGFDELEQRMREFVPHLKRIKIRKQAVRRSEKELIRVGNESMTHRRTQSFQGEGLLFDFDNAKDVSAHGVSEGTLMLLGLMTVLSGPSQPQILLMDDTEHGLHPSAQRALLKVLDTVLHANPNLQIVATAHSPFMLDTVSGSQVRLVTSDASGHSIFGKMTDHPEFDRWKEEMTPGEYWTMIGESWIAEGSNQVRVASELGVELER